MLHEVEMTRSDAAPTLGVPRRRSFVPLFQKKNWFRIWLGRRPLLRLGRILPYELAALRTWELILLVVFLTCTAFYVATESLPKLTLEGCLAKKQKKDCEMLSYRVKKCVQHLGTLLHVFIALMILPVSRGSLCVRLTGLSFDKVVKYHRWLGRAVFVLTCIHGAGFYWNWIDSNALGDKFFKSHNFAGTVALLVLTVLHVSSFDSIRRANYHGFWVVHAVSGPALFLAIWLHHEGDAFVVRALAPLALLAVDKLYRGRQTAQKGVCQVRDITLIGANTVKLVLEGKNPLVSATRAKGERSIACAWVYLYCPALSSSEIHPFSVCNVVGLSSQASQLNGDELTVYVKDASWDAKKEGLCGSLKRTETWTQRLVAIASAGGQAMKDSMVLVEGPHGGLDLSVPLPMYDKLFFVAGGIGITPFLSLFIEASKEENQFPTTTLIWSIRDFDLLQEFLPILNACCGTSSIHAFIHFTGDVPGDQQAQESLPGEVALPPSQLGKLASCIRFVYGRCSAVESIIADSSPAQEELVGVLACGPKGLVRDALIGTAQVEHKYGFKAHYHEEVFHF